MVAVAKVFVIQGVGWQGGIVLWIRGSVTGFKSLIIIAIFER
jgi:hypothetical protein